MGVISFNALTYYDAPAPFVATASSSYGAATATQYAPMNAFDGVTTNYWIGKNGGTDWIQLDLGPGACFSPHNMTSDSAPGPFVASESSSYSVATYGGFAAFAANINNGWVSSSPTGWIQLDIGSGNTKLLGSYAIQARHNFTAARAPKDFNIQGSNDGTTWTTIDTQTSQTAWTDTQVRTFTCATQTTAYRYFRLNVTANNGDTNYIEIGQLVLYDQAGSVGSLLGAYTVQAASPSSDLPRAPKNWTVQGSNDNSTWTTLDTQTSQTGWAVNEQRTFFIGGTPTTLYRYYRLYSTANNGDATYTEIGELTFFGYPTTSVGRVTQVVAETLANFNPNARVTQVVAETLVNFNPNARVTQVTLETLANFNPSARVTQVVVEVLSSTVVVPAIHGNFVQVCS